MPVPESVFNQVEKTDLGTGVFMRILLHFSKTPDCSLYIANKILLQA